ncbi:hypothetical protein F5Y09DRAFT_343891 [Xylaria sp. FL1042]|nr:hypothetical protein F5Y09DRAFT_343891 [Xylaria sp. FL1042]
MLDFRPTNDEIEGIFEVDVMWTVAMPPGLTGQGAKPVRTFEIAETESVIFITCVSCAKWMVDVAMGEYGKKQMRNIVKG